jgi:uncharacterized protein YbjT (DUF2867 family)
MSSHAPAVPRTVLVLTATGTTGQHVVAALLSAGAVVRAATRDPAVATLPAGAAAVRWSYDDPATWGPALAGVDALYLAIPPFRDDEVDVGRAILAAAQAAGVRRVVKLSAAGVEANPASTHRQLELAVEASGLHWVHLRPTFFNENFIEFYGQGVREAGVVALPAGLGRAGFVAAADIGAVAAVALLGAATGEAWTLTGPESIDHHAVAAHISAAIGRPVRYADISPTDFAAGLRAAGAGERAVETMGGLYEFVRAGWADGVSADVERVLGRPPVAFADWARGAAGAWG